MSSMFKSLMVLCLTAGVAAYTTSTWCDVASDSTGKFLVALGKGGTDSLCWQVLTSDDFGATWKYTSAPQSPWGSVYSDPTGNHLVIGPRTGTTYSTSQPMYSLDRGVTWVAGTYNNEASVGKIFLDHKISADTSAKHLVTVTDAHKLIHSRDGGASWIGIDNVPSNVTYGVNGGYASVISGNGNNIYATNDVGAIYLSTNAGTSWTKKQDGCSTCGNQWENFVTDNYGTILFAATTSKVFVSTDSGATLTQINDKIATANTILDIYTDAAAKYAYVLCYDGLYVYTRSTGTYVKNPTLKYASTSFSFSVVASSNGQHIDVSVQPYQYISDDFGGTWRSVVLPN